MASLYRGPKNVDALIALSRMLSKPGARICGSRFARCLAEVGLVITLMGMFIAPSQAAGGKNLSGMIATNGQAASVIVVGNHASPSDRFVAGELQHYIELLSGAKLGLITAGDVGRQAKGLSLLLVGGPAGNELVGEASHRGQINFSGLKPEGYFLRRITTPGRPALVIGGNDEAGTMYAAYDLTRAPGIRLSPDQRHATGEARRGGVAGPG